MTAARRRGIDTIRRDKMRERAHGEIAWELSGEIDITEAVEAAVDDDLGDRLFSGTVKASLPIDYRRKGLAIYRSLLF